MAGNIVTLSDGSGMRPVKYNGAVYLSGPITGTEYKNARYGWRATAAGLLNKGITILSPMRHEGHLAEQGVIGAYNSGHFFSSPRVLVEKDNLDIKRSDIVLAYLKDADRVSIGTMVEIGMAYEAGKMIVAVVEKGSIHDHPFVTETAGLVVDNLEDACAAINSLLSEGL